MTSNFDISVLCALCHQVFSYHNMNDIPKSDVHNTLLDVTTMNYDIKGRWTKCQQIQFINAVRTIID